MPYKKRKTFRRKPVRRAKRKTGPTTGYVVSRQPKPIPDRMFLKMAYSDCITINSTVTPGAFLFRSSLFDPQYNVGGHQPFGFDQWVQFYKSYTVYGIGYDIECINTGTSLQAEVAVVAKNTALLTTSMNTIYEKPFHRTAVLGVEGSGKNVRRLKGYISVAQQHGVNKSKIKFDDEFSSLMTTNPLKQAYLHIYSQAIDGTTSLNVIYRVKLTYFTQLFNRIALGGS